MWSKKVLAFVAAVVAAVALAGCGSSGDTNTSAANGDAGASGSAWKIGSIASCSGTQAGSLGGVCKTMQVWADSVNAAGGINGHKIDLIVKDDASNPTTSTSMVRELIDKDHVIAIVGDSSNVDATWASYAQAKGVPVVGGLPISTTFISNPNFFGIGTNLLALNYATIETAKNAGFNKIGFLYCAESPQCSQSVPAFEGAAKLLGVEGTTAKVSATAPDYTAQCLQMKNAGIQTYEVGSGSDVVLRVLDSCKSQGLNAPLIQADGTFQNSWTKDKNTDGTLGVELTAPWFDSSIPGVKEFQDALQKSAPDVYNSDLYGPGTFYGWISGKLFEAAAKAGNLGDNPTSADVTKGLFALKDETLGGLIAPTTYQQGSKGAPFLNTCYWNIQIKDGKYISLNGGKPTCIDPAKLAPLMPKG
ncbi:ABC transporter substrate-binding protein [Gordonia polyisoprenivorans]|uniref:ABC transporter substrate-binding protein n=1 Tax=Gordonia polyisoprenivorans TaxID=84595 RepID=UPI001AD67687|nr:ABC transporter substrate-binding protein [Gordonia polyisoprenivorans]QTI70999.1 ABC transporter substrate-binding protein [Gordonia polyisoprenivorans]